MAISAGEVEVILRLRDEMTAALKTATQSLEKAGTSLTQLGNVAGGLNRTFPTLAQQFSKAGEALGKVGAGAERAGRDLLPLSVALTAAAAGALKFSTDFEATMTKTVTIAAESAEGLGRMKQAVLDLAPTVGIGPNELARALLVVESTGIKGADALDILKSSAKASAAGLGETKDIARAITAAITAYGKENLSAAKASDILFAAVKAGGAEADEFAGALGRVIGIAAQVGVQFDEVSGFIATFTRLGVNAEEAVTALRGTMSTILKPSKEAREQLAALGTSVEELRNNIKSKGLTEALIELVQATKGNDEAMAAIIPNVRALAGVLGTAGSQAGAMREVLDAVKNSTGALDKAFDVTTTTGAFKWAQFKAEIERVAITFGDKLAPHAMRALEAMKPILKFIEDLAGAFAGLPQPVQTAILGIAAAFAVGGPLLIGLGAATKAVGNLAEAFAWFLSSTGGKALTTGFTSFATSVLPQFTGTVITAEGAATGLAAALGPFGLLLGALGLGFMSSKRDMDAWIASAEYAAAIAATGQTGASARRKVNETPEAYLKRLQEAKATADKFANSPTPMFIDEGAFKAGLAAAENARKALIGQGSLNTLAAGPQQAGESIEDYLKRLQKAADAAKGLTIDLAALRGESAKPAPAPKAKPLTEEQQKLQDQLFGRDTIKNAQEMIAVLGGVGKVSTMTKDAQLDLNQQVTKAIEAYRALGLEVPENMRAVADATLRAAVIPDAMVKLNESAFQKIKELAGSVTASTEESDRWLKNLQTDLTQFLALSAQFDEAFGRKPSGRDAADAFRTDTMRAIRGIAKEGTAEFALLQANVETVYANMVSAADKATKDATDIANGLPDAFTTAWTESGHVITSKIMKAAVDASELYKKLLAEGKSAAEAYAAALKAFEDQANKMTLGQSIKGQLQAAAKAFPGMIAQAIINGGSVATAIRATLVSVSGSIGQSIGDDIGKSISGYGSKIGGAMGGMLKGLGSMMGSLASAGISMLVDLGLKALEKAIVYFGGNQTKDARDALAKNLGLDDAGELYKKLQGMGSAGEQLAQLGLQVIGRNDVRGNEIWMKKVQQFLTEVEQAVGRIGELGSALDAVGGFVPPSLEPLLDQLKSIEGLSPDILKMLDNLATSPSWQYMQERAEALGIELGGLGKDFQQSKIGDIALGYVRDLEMFKKGKADMTAVLTGMADELSAIASQAIKNGVLLPASLKPYIEMLAQMGKLIDENGQLIDTGALSFGEMDDEVLKSIRDLLNDIKDILAALPGLADEAAKAVTKLPPGRGRQSGEPLSIGGLPISDEDWRETGRGAGMTVNQYNSITAWDGRSIDQWMEEGGARKLADGVVPQIPDAVRRAGLG